MEKLMKDRLESVQVRSHDGLEHINLTTADGDPVPHAIGRRIKPNVGDAPGGINCGRSTDTHQGLMHKLIDAIKRKWFRRRG
ncbi:hypothetical protein [Acidovorax sp.]|uniref:hypothetical protein n=1 Tax=Acidovorax sp. TaxID=1872122 RepID=UPI0025BA7182|nr:hypothetical protein [Acidovorax sp.]